MYFEQFERKLFEKETFINIFKFVKKKEISQRNSVA